MKATVFVSSLLAGAALASPGPKRAACNADNCARALTGTYRGTSLPSARRSDCSSFQQCTVFPATVTSTVTATVFPTTQTATYVVSTSTNSVTYTTLLSTIATFTDVESVTSTSTEVDTVTNIVTVTQALNQNKRRTVAPASFTTVCPSQVPSYASACSGSSRFSSACSCAGITKSQSTVAATPTTTVTVTQVGQTTVTVTTTALETTSIIAISSVTASVTVDTTIVDVVTSTSVVTQTSIVPAATGNAYCQNGQPVNGLSAPCTSVGCSTTNLRIEGRFGTLYEGTILSGPANVTLPSGGTHLCDGTNNNANPIPFANGIGTIVAAGGLCGFGVDGTWSPQFQDFFIQTIGDTPSTGNQFWGILLNYAFTPAGGCETEVRPTDELLWAFNAFNVNFFLRVQPTQTPVVLAPGQSYTFQVQGSDGNGNFSPISGASFAGLTSDGNGNVAFVAPTAPGTYRYKATRGDSIRSNAVTVVVQG